MSHNGGEAVQAETFDRLIDRVGKLLEQFGRHDSLLEMGDYSIYGDYWGFPQVKVTVENLKLLRPDIVERLQGVVADFPGWEIVVAVAVPEHISDWPDMGLYIRPHEIIDGLQRQYFPAEYQTIEYAGSRRGTEQD
ncbi:hypothetical protein [Rhodoplanes serenus]|uniref:hypothetical protein n=1 Tax=Rhodoplanes serenus TaxID=200615 RepID=UPI0011B94AF7|nr:hypothetical protein [Rhodoplanes serenus]